MTVESALLLSNLITLFAFISVLIAFIWNLGTQDKKEMKYINAVLAKDIKEYSKAVVEQTTIDPEAVEKNNQPEFIPETDLSDEAWFKTIEQN